MHGLSLISPDKSHDDKPFPIDIEVDMASLVPIIDRLRIQLEEMDPDAEGTAADLSGKLGEFPQRKSFEILRQQISDFEFEDAIMTLDKLQSTLEDTA